MMYGWHDGGRGPGAWIAMGLMMLAFWAFVAVLVVYVVRNVGHRPPGEHAASVPDAMRILDERFARGELDADEYIRRRDLLRTR